MEWRLAANVEEGARKRSRRWERWGRRHCHHRSSIQIRHPLQVSCRLASYMTAASSNKGLHSAEELHEVKIETTTNPVASRSKWEREESGCLTPSCLMHWCVPACTRQYPRLNALGQGGDQSSNQAFPSGLARKVNLHEWNQALWAVQATKHALLASVGVNQPTYRQPNTLYACQHAQPPAMYFCIPLYHPVSLPCWTTTHLCLVLVFRLSRLTSSTCILIYQTNCSWQQMLQTKYNHIGHPLIKVFVTSNNMIIRTNHICYVWKEHNPYFKMRYNGSSMKEDCEWMCFTNSSIKK